MRGKKNNKIIVRIVLQLSPFVAGDCGVDCCVLGGLDCCDWLG